ncbi:hypothetical protein ADM99_16145 [Leptolinea tardivitalis]|uniref:Uncharacterized protein n=1 Tax=Leptolinea tardivitalis TaxID=229920 RepID=A0A0P6XHQ0_9CHLR|nr:hypothetical protein ADM99_16145 [Leptolinea tardivitalis]
MDSTCISQRLKQAETRLADSNDPPRLLQPCKGNLWKKKKHIPLPEPVEGIGPGGFDRLSLRDFDWLSLQRELS